MASRDDDPIECRADARARAWTRDESGPTERVVTMPSLFAHTNADTSRDAVHG